MRHIFRFKLYGQEYQFPLYPGWWFLFYEKKSVSFLSVMNIPIDTDVGAACGSSEALLKQPYALYILLLLLLRIF
jgi:hypothetical protein